MLRGDALPTTAVGETRMSKNETYEGGVNPGGRRIEDCESTLTFEPQELVASSTPLAHPAPLVDNRNNNIRRLSSNPLHQRQQSAPSFPSLPYAFDTRQGSPIRGGGHARHQSQGMPYTGDGRARSGGRGGGGGRRWLSGTSTPPNDGGAASADTTPKSKRGAATDVDNSTPRSGTAAPSRFGFLASITTRLTSQSPGPTQTPEEVDEELCSLDIEAALYPASSLSPMGRDDAFSPAAYKNLRVNATGLLRKMQEAYRQRVTALREVEAEREAQREEAEETELRIRSLRNQLETMAAKAAQQEREMQGLVAEVQAEREKNEMRRNQTRGRLLRGEREGMILTTDSAEEVPLNDGEEKGVEEDGQEEEDEEEERDMWRKRKSAGTVRSDLSIDTTTTSSRDSAESESIFSRSRSPTAMTSATESENLELPTTTRAPAATSTATATNTAATPPPLPTINLPPRIPKPSTPQQQQLTAFQKLVKGISGGGAGEVIVESCSNCQGRDSSVAWDTVSLLRDENKGLKHRVAQLEVVVEGALDVVNGIGL
ncbi:hypothetical protein AAE478_003519 [Parahypoxylon ruwenzoriense]